MRARFEGCKFWHFSAVGETESGARAAWWRNGRPRIGERRTREGISSSRRREEKLIRRRMMMKTNPSNWGKGKKAALGLSTKTEMEDGG